MLKICQWLTCFLPYCYNHPMDKDSLLYRTREIVRTDRLELMRENADKQKTYCFFASLYEVAYHIHKDKMPPRYKQAEAEWLSFGVDDKPGAVKTEEILNLLTKLANSLGITIEKIYTDRLFLSHFLQDKVRDATVVDTGKKKTIYRAHAESYTSLPKSDRRIDTVLADDWITVVAVPACYGKERDLELGL